MAKYQFCVMYSVEGHACVYPEADTEDEAREKAERIIREDYPGMDEYHIHDVSIDDVLE